MISDCFIVFSECRCVFVAPTRAPLRNGHRQSCLQWLHEISCRTTFDQRSGIDQGVDTTSGWRVLIISAERNRDLVVGALSNWAIEPTCCSTLEQARTLLPDETFSTIFCEDTLPDGTYLDLLNNSGKPMKTRVVVISELSNDQHYNEAKQAGAFDLISSPCHPSDVQWMVIRAIQEESRHTGTRRRF